MEDLIKEIQERTGLPADKVLEVVTIVTEFLKENLPDDLIEQITKYIGQAASTGKETAGTAGSAAASSASTAVTAAAGVASSVIAKAMEMIGEFMPSTSSDAKTADEEAPANTDDESE